MKIPDEAVETVAAQMLARYASEYDADHMSSADFADDARSDLEAVLPLIASTVLEAAAEEIVIPGASSLAAAWLQGRAARLRNQAAGE